MRKIIIALLLISTHSYAEEKSNLFIKEVVKGDLPYKTEYFIQLCSDDLNYIYWCEGYISASVTSFEKQGVKLCLPLDEKGLYTYEMIWTVIKSWIYLHPETKEERFYNVIKSALTDEAKCKK